MSCYCTEIKKIKTDIVTLEAMEKKLGTIVSTNATQLSVLKQLASSAKATASPDNAATLSTKITGLNDKVKNNGSSMQTQVSTELTTLRRKRDSLTVYDNSYHKETNTKKK